MVYLKSSAENYFIVVARKIYRVKNQIYPLSIVRKGNNVALKVLLVAITYILKVLQPEQFRP